MHNASIKRFFGDNEYRFQLTGAQVVELERQVGKGIGAIYADALAMRFGYIEVVETLRLGLIGAGSVPPARARQLCDLYALPLTPSYTLALEVLAAVFSGPQVEPAPADKDTDNV